MLVNREPRGPEPAKGRMTAATACRTCAIEPREGARFSDGCGAPVTANDTRAEYKQVTVLFADVVHSMDIAAVSGINAPRSGDQARAVGGGRGQPRPGAAAGANDPPRRPANSALTPHQDNLCGLPADWAPSAKLKVKLCTGVELPISWCPRHDSNVRPRD